MGYRVLGIRVWGIGFKDQRFDRLKGGCLGLRASVLGSAFSRMPQGVGLRIYGFES